MGTLRLQPKTDVRRECSRNPPQSHGNHYAAMGSKVRATVPSDSGVQDPETKPGSLAVVVVAVAVAAAVRPFQGASSEEH